MSSLAVRGSGPGRGGGLLRVSWPSQSFPTLGEDAPGRGVTSCYTKKNTQLKLKAVGGFNCATRPSGYCTREGAIVVVTGAVFPTLAKLYSMA